MGKVQRLHGNSKQSHLKGKIMEASKIKKILYGVVASDGSINGRKGKRFSIYSKNEEYVNYLYEVVSDLTHTTPTIRKRTYKDKDYVGWEMYCSTSKYWLKMYDSFYPNNGRKALSNYTVSRFDAESLAHIWMCDGYLEHAKNRKLDKVQNVGWFCLEAFPREELEIFQKFLSEKFSIESTLSPKPWGFGFRLRVGGESLQRLISIVYPYILDCFKYKTILFYKRKETALELPSAEHYVHTYNVVDDIVRHPLKDGQT
jgi:hypothetical protein